MNWLTTKEVAAELGKAVVTIERWRLNGVLKPVQRTKGNHSRYSRKQIERFKNNVELEGLMS